jgi:hypothetical protein
MTIPGQSSASRRSRGKSKTHSDAITNASKVAKKKKQARACGAKSPRAEACDLRRGHRGPHSWSWIRKLNQPIRSVPSGTEGSEEI